MTRPRIQPTKLSLDHARRAGWLVDVVERWIPFHGSRRDENGAEEREPRGPGIRRDLFGFADLVVLDGAPGTLYVQTTSASNLAARRAKILANDALPRILRAGNRVELWIWERKTISGRERFALRVFRFRIPIEPQPQTEGDEWTL